MYAVIETGGKQYRVTEGQVLTVEKLDVEAGKTIEFNNVLMVSSEAGLAIGGPYVTGSQVVAEAMGEGRHDKIKIIKFRRRKHYRRQQGHRQYFTKIKISKIIAS